MVKFKFVEKIRNKIQEIKEDYEFYKNEQGGNAVTYVIILFVSAILAGTVLPSAINNIESTNTSSWGSDTATLWGILSVMIVLGVILYFIPIDRLRKME